MKRWDLRAHKNDFLNRMMELINNDLGDNEVGIFLFEVGDFSGIYQAHDIIKENNWILLNSLRFNEVDWTIIVKKANK